MLLAAGWTMALNWMSEMYDGEPRARDRSKLFADEIRVVDSHLLDTVVQPGDVGEREAGHVCARLLCVGVCALGRGPSTTPRSGAGAGLDVTPSQCVHFQSARFLGRERQRQGHQQSVVVRARRDPEGPAP